MDRLSRLVEDGRDGTLELGDLFDIGFTVEEVNGKVVVCNTLDELASNGSTMTLKPLLYFSLIRHLTDRGARVEPFLPFYLDEIASVDPNNQRTILAFSENLGFTPVFASVDLGERGAKRLLVSRILRRGVGALDPIADRFGQQVTSRRTQDALFAPVEGLHCPRNIECVLDKPVVTEGHPDLKTDGHAHPVLAIKQCLDEAGQVDVAHLAHAPIRLLLRRQYWGFAERLTVAVL
jgi:hypothetical protein